MLARSDSGFQHSGLAEHHKQETGAGSPAQTANVLGNAQLRAGPDIWLTAYMTEANHSYYCQPHMNLPC